MNFWHGLSTVVSLELKQRVRSKLWVWALVIWFLFIGAVTSLVMTVVTTSGSSDPQQQNGPLAFGLIVLFVLGMGLVIAPTFTATSINSDRSQSVLATLQATRLSALQIALGKLAAAWGISLLFIAAALPFIVWTVALGNISLAQVAACFAAIFIEVAVVCAIGLGWSALVARPVGSAVLTYLSVLTLCVLTLVVELLSLSLVVEDDEVRVWGLSSTDQTAYEEQYYSGDSDDWVNAASWAEKCTWNREQTTAPRFDKVWWLSLPNPFVVVADAAPLPPGVSDLRNYTDFYADPLAMIKFAVRQSAQPPETERDDCLHLVLVGEDSEFGYDDEGNVWVTNNGIRSPYTSPVKNPPLNIDTPIWPWGMGIDLVLGAGFFIIAWRRLRVPYGKLPQGQRVA